MSDKHPEHEKPLSKQGAGKPSPEEEEDKTGQGGQSGVVEFRISDERLGPTRDDLKLSDLKTKISEHRDRHKHHVDQQKQLRQEREALKNGEKPKQSIREQLSHRGQGGSGKSASKHRDHPILSQKAQFDGVDKTLVGIPNKNETDANPENKAELDNRLENKLQNRLTAQPKFNPRPKFPGS